jgi:serine/threonine-protein kinase
MPARLGPGSRIAGYVLEERIGVGGMAVVFRARDSVLHRLTAVKVLSPALADDEEFRARFLRESRTIATVDEPHILTVYAAGEADGVLYIAAKFIAGGDLAGLLRRNGGPLAAERTASLVTQVASALDAAHAAGLVHRDVKPANVLVDDIPGRGEHAYLSDFGLSKAASAATTLTASGMFLGTPDYSAPEQATGSTPVSAATDQYALACVAFHLLAGVVPYKREEPLATLFAHVQAPVPSVTALRPELPPAVDAVLAKAMAKDPADRYQSCGQFAAALRATLAPAAIAGAAGAGHVPFPPFRPGEDTIAATPPKTAAGRGSPPPPETVAAAPGAGGVPGRASPGGVATIPGTGGRPAITRKRAIIAGSVAGAALLATGIGITLARGGPAALGAQGGLHPSTVNSVNARPNVTTSKRKATPSRPVSLKPIASIGDTGPATLSEDGKLLVISASDAVHCYVFNLVTGTHKTFSLPGNIFSPAYAFSADDKTLTAVDSSAPGGVYRWNLSTGQVSSVMALPSGAGTATGAISEDATTLAIVDSAGTGVDVWDLRTATRIAELPDPGDTFIVRSGFSSAGAITLDKDGGLVCVADSGGNVYVWSVSRHKVIARLRYKYNSSINPATISPDGKLVEINYPAVGGGNTLWDVATQANVTPSDPRWAQVGTGEFWFSSDGKAIATNRGGGGSADLWDTATRTRRATLTFPDPPGRGTSVAAVGPDGTELVADNTGKGRSYLWRVSY